MRKIIAQVVTVYRFLASMLAITGSMWRTEAQILSIGGTATHLQMAKYKFNVNFLKIQKARFLDEIS